MEIHPIWYSRLIDPMLKSPREKLVQWVNTSDKVLDIACGTGVLVRDLAIKCRKVMGIDIDERMIDFARGKLTKDIRNIEFRKKSALSLACFEQNEFSISTFSLAIHQFFPAEQEKILLEAIKVSEKMFIADYSFPLPGGYKKWLVHSIERMAGKDHYRNFRSFLRAGGIPGIIENAGLKLVKSDISDSGVFTVYHAEKH